jgi:hypothetical protein
MVCRGRVIENDLVEFGGRYDDLAFLAPNPMTFVDRLPLSSPSGMADLYALRFGEVLDYLEALGKRLDVETNLHMQEAQRLTYQTAPTTPSIVDTFYRNIPSMFARPLVRDIAEKKIGVEFLEGWVKRRYYDGSIVGVRAFGSRTVHIVAGNGPSLSALSLIRSAISRSDCIIKAPSNDPFTAIAIGKTMIDMAPDHPLTRHFSAAYWRGGDEAFERQLYQPHNVEKIIAWGGLASVRHVTRYIQPGLELISLDPKRSVSIIGPEAFRDERTFGEAAIRLAADIGTMNQQACASARVAYVFTGTDAAGLDIADRFGRHVYSELVGLPPHLSTRPRGVDPELQSHVNALRQSDDFFRVHGGESGEGAIIVSRTPEAVDFATRLDHRTANIVPVDNLAQVLGGVDAYTQTVGVYPEAFKDGLLDVLPAYGAQRFVSLGSALRGVVATPQDAIEPLRRMCKWIVNEINDPETYAPTTFGIAIAAES